MKHQAPRSNMKKKYSIKQVLELVKGSYGEQRFRNFYGV